jgi:hypothetical protein
LCDFTYALAAEWWEGCGKTGARNRAFPPDFYKTQVLTFHLCALKRLAKSLRRTSGKMVACYFSTYSACGRIWIFARRRDGKQQFAMPTDATKLRKIFRREAAHR